MKDKFIQIGQTILEYLAVFVLILLEINAALDLFMTVIVETHKDDLFFHLLTFPLELHNKFLHMLNEEIFSLNGRTIEERQFGQKDLIGRIIF
jgi:hypothetical protein